MQLLYYLMFFNVDFPDNLNEFFKIFSLGRLQFLPNPFANLNIKGSVQELKSPPKFYENNYTGLFIEKTGSMLFIWISSIGVYFSAKILLCFKRALPQRIAQIAVFARDFYEWSGILRLFTSTYFELFLAAILQIRVLNFGHAFLAISSLAG